MNIIKGNKVVPKTMGIGFDGKPENADSISMTRVSAKKVVKQKEEMEAFRKKVTSTKKEARSFLKKTGIYTEKGELTPAFR